MANFTDPPGTKRLELASSTMMNSTTPLPWIVSESEPLPAIGLVLRDDQIDRIACRVVEMLSAQSRVGH